MKRKLAAVMAVIITASQTLAFPAFAVTAVTPDAPAVSGSETKKSTASEEEKMKAALTLVKSRITIPEEYSNFSYTSGESNGMSRFSFTWKTPSGNDSYSVELKGNIITRFSSPDRDIYYRSKPSLAPYDRDHFVNNAVSFLCKANPCMTGRLKNRSVSLDISSGAVTVYFDGIYNDIPVDSHFASVTLNKKTGEVLSFYSNWWQDAEFESADKALSQEAIKEIYCGEVSVKPWYRIFTDEQTGKKRTNIVYTPLNSFVYNAFTGKHSSIDEDRAKWLNTDKIDPATGEYEEAAIEEDCIEECEVETPDTGVKLTEEELAAAADLSTMLTSAQFKKLMLKDPFMGITEKYIVSNFNIEKNENAECGYSIRCDLYINNKKETRNVSITADAKSGKVMDFYSTYDECDKELNVEEANALAQKAVKYYFGDIADEYRADTENTAPVSVNGKYKTTYRNMRYYRYVNNIQVSNNYISVEVNSEGKVVNINSSHDRDVDFGDGLIVNKETALKLVCEQQDMKLGYDGFLDLKSVPHTYLHYYMDDWSLNAVTGKLCDYNGNPVKIRSESKGCPYTDIESSPYKKEIEALYDHGIKIYSGDKFMPNEKMTLTEFENLLGRIIGNSYEPMPLMEIDMSEEKAPSQNGGYFTRMDLAKEFTRAAGVDICARYNNIFKSPFTDVSEDDKDLGYAALAYGMGAVNCGKNGKFYPNAYVTREYAFHCAYSYIKNNS